MNENSTVSVFFVIGLLVVLTAVGVALSRQPSVYEAATDKSLSARCIQSGGYPVIDSYGSFRRCAGDR